MPNLILLVASLDLIRALFLLSGWRVFKAREEFLDTQSVAPCFPVQLSRALFSVSPPRGHSQNYVYFGLMKEEGVEGG